MIHMRLGVRLCIRHKRKPTQYYIQTTNSFEIVCFLVIFAFCDGIYFELYLNKARPNKNVDTPYREIAIVF